MLSTQANLTIRDAEDHVLMSGSDIKQGSAKQNLNKKQINQLLHLKLKVKINLKSH